MAIEIDTMAPMFIRLTKQAKKRWPNVPTLNIAMDEQGSASGPLAVTNFLKDIVTIDTKRFTQLEENVARMVLIHELAHFIAWRRYRSDVHDDAWRSVIEFFGEEGRELYSATSEYCGACIGGNSDDGDEEG